jgi:hypothetical protein
MRELALNTSSMSQLAHVIAQTIVPAFLLGALAGFLPVLVSLIDFARETRLAIREIDHLI